jgi:phosphopantothenoylcysteine decarboxylase / phosphopantothenate---cysteine ligase
MARILLGVTGGIAAYKALEFTRLAMASGHSVRAVQTESAQRFVGAASFEAITGAPVLTSEWETDPARGAFPGQPLPEHEPLNHLELVRNADVYLIAPATANTIAKLAGGLADNLVTSCVLAASCPVVVAPAMNHHMWRNAATQANVALLRERGITVIDPGEGALASRGEWGEGRLAPPEELLAAVEAQSPAGERPWDGLRVLVTAGGTREPIDEVRFIGNRSSGRMGIALAEAALGLGADVTVICANTSVPVPAGAEVVEAVTTGELAAACAVHFPAADLLLMAAAISDFRTVEPVTGKLERGGDGLTLELAATEDILAGLVAGRREDQVVVAFAAEHGEGAEERAARKLERKGADAIVVNDVSRPDIGFESSRNEVTIITGGEAVHLPIASKAEIAAGILAFCSRLLEGRRRSAV